MKFNSVRATKRNEILEMKDDHGTLHIGCMEWDTPRFAVVATWDEGRERKGQRLTNDFESQDLASAAFNKGVLSIDSASVDRLVLRAYAAGVIAVEGLR